MSAAITSMHSPTSQRPQKKQKMSITQTYFLAHTARGKLSKEASRSDHDLRLLVGHANLLDTLMLDLANAEQEQEQWFNHTVSETKAEEEQQSARHIKWADTVIEEPEEDWQAEDAESTASDSEDEEETMTATSIAISKSIIATTITTRELSDEEESEDDDEEDLEDLALMRTSSHHVPELTSDSEEDSEDESMPPSPPSTTLDAFTEKERQAIATTSYYDKKSSEQQLSESEQSDFFEDGYYLPSRQQPAMVSAY